VKSKAFLISQALNEAKVDAATSVLGLDGFKKLLPQGKKDQPDKSVNGKKKRTERG
jgi:hypothetical protein